MYPRLIPQVCVEHEVILLQLFAGAPEAVQQNHLVLDAYLGD
jgi:hypothetical protein